MGKSRSLEESGGRKTHMALTAAPEEAADMRVVQCLIHASAVSDSGSAAPFSSSSFEVMAKLRAESGGRASVSAAVCGVGMNLALNYSHFL